MGPVDRQVEYRRVDGRDRALTTPVEFMIWAALDAPRSGAALAVQTGLDEDTVLGALAALAARGVVRGPPPAGTAAEPHDPASPAAKREWRPSRPHGAVPADDPRLEPEHPIALELQRRLWWLDARLDELDPFALLELGYDADAAQVKAAYRALSRQLHPDAYYGKPLGALRAVLDRAFDRVRAAHDLLRRDDERAAAARRFRPAPAAAPAPEPTSGPEPAPGVSAGPVAADRPPSAAAGGPPARRPAAARPPVEAEGPGRRERDLERLRRAAERRLGRAPDEIERRRAARRDDLFARVDALARDRALDEALALLEASAAELGADPGHAARVGELRRAKARARAHELGRQWSALRGRAAADAGAAVRVLRELVELDPSAELLIELAKLAAPSDGGAARKWLLRGLELLGASSLSDRRRAELRLVAVEVFDALGQRATALAQLELAGAVLGESDAYRRLSHRLRGDRSS